MSESVRMSFRHEVVRKAMVALETVEKFNTLSVMNKNHKENRRRLLDDLEDLKAQFKDKRGADQGGD